MSTTCNQQTSWPCGFVHQIHIWYLQIIQEQNITKIRKFHSIYHPQKQLNRVSVPHVPRSKEISHIRDLAFVCDLFLVAEWQMCMFLCRIWSHIVATCFNSVGPSHGHGPATLPRSLDTFGGHVATPNMAPCLSIWIIYIYDFWVILEGKFWQICYMGMGQNPGT